MPPHEQNWIANLRLDFVNGPHARVFFGYLKESPDYKATLKWRLYLTLDFEDYIEFHETDDHLASISLESHHNPVGGTVVWLRKSAVVRYVGVETRQLQASFLRGQLASEFLGGTGSEALAGQSGGVMKLPGGTGYWCTQITQCAPCEGYTSICPTVANCLFGRPQIGGPQVR